MEISSVGVTNSAGGTPNGTPQGQGTEVPPVKKRKVTDCVTETKEVILKYTWEIRNFSILRARAMAEQIGDDNRVFSPPFGSDQMTGRWRLCLWPAGEDRQDANAAGGAGGQPPPPANNEERPVSLFCHLVSPQEVEVVASAHFACLDNDQNEIDSTMMQTRVRKFSHQEGKESNRGFSEFLSADQLDDVLFNDRMTIYCEMRTIPQSEHEEPRALAKACSDMAGGVQGKALGNDLGSLIDTGSTMHSDVVLVCNNEDIPAHRCILAARSTVFRNMLSALRASTSQSSTEGIAAAAAAAAAAASSAGGGGGQVGVGVGGEVPSQQQQRLVVSDVSPNILKVLLRYIYCDSCKELEASPFPHATVVDILKAANRFNIHGLRERCGEALVQELSVQNVAHLLIEASLHGTETLKKQCLRFAAKHYRAVSKTEGFSKLDRHPTLLKDLMHILATQFTKQPVATQS